MHAGHAGREPLRRCAWDGDALPLGMESGCVAVAFAFSERSGGCFFAFPERSGGGSLSGSAGERRNLRLLREVTRMSFLFTGANEKSKTEVESGR